MERQYLQIEIDGIGQRFGCLRIMDPKAEAAMERSLMKYGQITPVIVGSFEKGGYELIDGFKRLRMAGKLNYRYLDARVFTVGIRAAKAAMIYMKVRSGTISE